MRTGAVIRSNTVCHQFNSKKQMNEFWFVPWALPSAIYILHAMSVYAYIILHTNLGILENHFHVSHTLLILYFGGNDTFF